MSPRAYGSGGVAASGFAGALLLLWAWAGAAAPARGLALGVNIGGDGIADWSPETIFADAMKQARRFGSVAAPWDEAAPVDAAGWPTGDAGVVVIADLPNISGTYKLSYTGRGAVALTASPDVTLRDVAWSAGTNTTTADVVAGSSARNIMLTFTGIPEGVRNVTLFRPGHTGADTFQRDFLNRVRAGPGMFQVLRFMGFTMANFNKQVNWSDRTLPSHATQQRGFQGAAAGAAWEYVIELCNLTGKDPWINVPHKATDEYVRNLATLFKERLGPARRIYVEFSNELWNEAFAQTGDNRAAATAEVEAGDPHRYRYDDSGNRHEWAWRRIAYNAKRVSDIFRGVFGDAAMKTRVRPVLAGQLANSDVIREGLKYLAAVHGPPRDYLYAASGAPYIGMDVDGTSDANLTVDEVFARMRSYGARVDGWISSLLGLCETYDLKMVAYEGGQGLFGKGSQAAKASAQTDPRMKDLIVQLLDGWRSKRGDLFVYWNLCSSWGPHGYWGLSKDITSEATPKWEALKQIAAPR